MRKLLKKILLAIGKVAQLARRSERVGMVIIVASANIFRRELTSYTLGEAQYDVCESRSLSELQHLIVQEHPYLIVADASIAQPDTLVSMIRSYTLAPLIWIGTFAERQPAAELLSGLIWPYLPDELLNLVSEVGHGAYAATESRLPKPALGLNE